MISVLDQYHHEGNVAACTHSQTPFPVPVRQERKPEHEIEHRQQKIPQYLDLDEEQDDDEENEEEEEEEEEEETEETEDEDDLNSDQDRDPLLTAVVWFNEERREQEEELEKLRRHSERFGRPGTNLFKDRAEGQHQVDQSSQQRSPNHPIELLQGLHKTESEDDEMLSRVNWTSEPLDYCVRIDGLKHGKKGNDKQNEDPDPQQRQKKQDKLKMSSFPKKKAACGLQKYLNSNDDCQYVPNDPMSTAEGKLQVQALLQIQKEQAKLMMEQKRETSLFLQQYQYQRLGYSQEMQRRLLRLDQIEYELKKLNRRNRAVERK